MRSENLLFVDKETEIFDTVKTSLKQEGYEPIYSSSTSEAVSIIQKKKIGVMMLNLALPELNCLEMLRNVRSISPLTGSIVISRNDPIDKLFRSFEAGAQAVLINPFDTQNVKRVIEEVIQKSQLAKENMRLNTLSPLFHLSKSIVSEMNSFKIFQHIVRTVRSETKAQKASLLIQEEMSKELVVKAIIGSRKNCVGKKVMPPDDRISASVIRTGKAVLINENLRKNAEGLSYIPFSALCVPLRVKGKVTGVINCSKTNTSTPFKESDLKLLSILAGQAAIVIENTILFDNVNESKNNADMLLKKCLTAQEEERKRISSELHDGLAQWIISASYAMQSGDKLIANSDYTNGRIEIKRAYNIITDCVKELRRVIRDLHPQVLADLGLVEAIQQYLYNYFRQNGIVVDFQTSGDAKHMSTTQEITLYRVILEALNNVRKHSQASQVNIVLRFGSKCIYAKIEDNGSGFDVQKKIQTEAENGSIGLINMHERAAMVGGDLFIKSTIGKGTSVMLTMPAKICQN